MRYELIGLGMDYRRRHSATVTPVQAVLALLVVAAIVVVTAWSLVPPEPVGSDAWPDAFSAERAVTDIEAILQSVLILLALRRTIKSGNTC